MFIPDPDFYPSRIPDLGSRIPDPKTATKERGEKNCYNTLFVVTNFTKLNLILFLKCLRNKFRIIFKELRVIEVFTQKVFTKLSKIYFWDPRAGIRKNPIPDPGSRIQGVKKALDPGSGSVTLQF